MRPLRDVREMSPEEIRRSIEEDIRSRATPAPMGDPEEFMAVMQERRVIRGLKKDRIHLGIVGRGGLCHFMIRIHRLDKLMAWDEIDRLMTRRIEKAGYKAAPDEMVLELPDGQFFVVRGPIKDAIRLELLQ